MAKVPLEWAVALSLHLSTLGRSRTPKPSAVISASQSARTTEESVQSGCYDARKKVIDALEIHSKRQPTEVYLSRFGFLPAGYHTVSVRYPETEAAPDESRESAEIPR